MHGFANRFLQGQVTVTGKYIVVLITGVFRRYAECSILLWRYSLQEMNLSDKDAVHRVNMRVAKKTAENRKIFHELVPLNSLSPERFRELSEKIIVEEVKAGRYLFRKGDRDNQTIFLLEGTITLIDGFRKVAGEIQAGTDLSRHPISNLQPRQYAARAVSRSVIARIDSGLLDVFLTWDPSNTAEVVDIGAADNTDWMTRILQSEAFVRLPPSKLQALLMRFKPIEVKKGQVIIAQGSEGEHFYTIHEGRCAVTRKESPGAPEQLLAELVSGDSFGEESLVSESRRNASVTMLTDGLLMRLAKQDFVDLLKAQMVKYISYREAKRLVDSGAVWVDVRTPDEYGRGSFEDSVNIPLSTLRGEITELVFNSKYVICCDTGSRSDSAAFVLSHRGFDVCVLEGGIGNLAVARDDAPTETAAVQDHGQVVAQTRQQLELVQAQLENEKVARQKVEAQLELVRGELAESGEKLGEFYQRVNRQEEERQLFIDRYEALRENHTDQLQALMEELDQEKKQSCQLRTLVSGLHAECDALRKKLGSMQDHSDGQYLQLQQQLDMALARAMALEDRQRAVRADDVALQDGDKLSVQEDSPLLESYQSEIGDTRVEAVHLRDILLEAVADKQQIEEQLQQMTHALSAMRDSVCGIAARLSDMQGQSGRRHDCSAMPEEGCDIEE